MEKNKYISLTINGYTCIDYIHHWDHAIDEATEFLANCVVGETLEIKIIEMTQEEFDALPEFEGF